MPPIYSQVERSSASLKRRRAFSAPCEDEAIRNSKRSRSDVDRSSIKPFSILGLQGDGTLNNEINKIDKGKAKPKQPPEVGCLTPPDMTLSNKSVIEELAAELKCGCCTELCYNVCCGGSNKRHPLFSHCYFLKPVVVNPCQHYFCGSCCVLWVQHGGSNCPACRGVSTSVVPSRVVQGMISMLLRLDPSKARTEGERMQADKVYRCGTSIILPTPRPKSPEPNLEAPNDNLARPCPTCLPGNPYGWQCPIPIQDPIANPDAAFDLDDGSPPGHAFCGNCDQLHNVVAPSTTKCDFCQVSFCGIEIQTRCCALGLLSQQAHGLSEIPDIIVNGNIYERFNENTVEVDIMLDYLRASRITLRSVYRDIVSHFMKHPQAFTALIDNGAFDDIHNVSGNEDPDPTAPRRRICRMCAAQVLIFGLKGWWIRERRKAKISEAFVIREDCQHGENCRRQTDPSHAKEFNHIIFDPYDTSNAGDTNVGPQAVASNSNPSSGPSGGSSSGAGREQSPLNGIVSRAVPFSILMPFPISRPNPERVEADEDIFPPPVPEHNNTSETSFPGAGYMTISFPFNNTNVDGGHAVRNDGVNANGSASGQAIVAQNTQRGVGGDYPEGQGQHAFLESSGPPYVSPDASGLPTSAGSSMISSSSLLSPVFPTST